MLEGQIIEVAWTIAPAIILVFIAVPSLRLLYLIDETHRPRITLKVIRHQWYWRYEYSDFIKVEFDSYIIPQDRPENTFRLLDVDNHTTLPINSFIRIIVTAADVVQNKPWGDFTSSSHLNRHLIVNVGSQHLFDTVCLAPFSTASRTTSVKKQIEAVYCSGAGPHIFSRSVGCYCAYVVDRFSHLFRIQIYSWESHISLCRIKAFLLYFNIHHIEKCLNSRLQILMRYTSVFYAMYKRFVWRTVHKKIVNVELNVK
jgi:hypothetical protein